MVFPGFLNDDHGFYRGKQLEKKKKLFKQQYMVFKKGNKVLHGFPKVFRSLSPALVFAVSTSEGAAPFKQ